MLEHNINVIDSRGGRLLSFSKLRAAPVSKKRHTRSLWAFHVVCALTAILFSTPISSFAASSLDAKLNAIVKKSVPPGYVISVQVADLGTGRVLMEKNADLPLVPASTMKAVTSAAALRTLKPDFTFVTKVLADGVRGSSVGNLYLKGYGDPYLVSEQIYALTREVRDKGLLAVRGNIIVDDSYFVPSKPLDENERIGYRAYHAPYSALSANFNSVKIVVHPGGSVGEPARLNIEPLSEYAAVRGEVQTTQGRKPAELEITKGMSSKGTEIIDVKGTIGVQAPPRGRYVNVDSPCLYTGGVFKEFLLREGIKVAGGVVRGKVPDSAETYVEFNSHPLATMIYWLNKFSNNFMAEQISLAMGAHVYGEPGTREKGLAVIRKYLQENGIPDESASLSEASGLSRNNRLAASALVRVLRNTARDFNCSPEYMASFGISGADGTLKEKFNDPYLKRRIRAKTGNLRGVNALAGYALSKEGRSLVFAAIVNSTQKPTAFIDYAEVVMRSVLNVSFDRR